MRIYGAIFYAVSVIVVQVSVSAKSLIFSKSGDGVSNVDQQSQNDVDFEQTKDNIVKSNVDSLLNSYKRSIDELGVTPSFKRSAFGSAPRKRSPYGLVYNQGKPIGILEPIAQSFEYSNYNNNPNTYHNSLYKSQWYPVKRDADSELDEGDRDQLAGQTSALHSSNYANVLAKFKVNNKVKHRPYQDFLYSQQVKRDATSEKLLGDLKKRGGLDIGELQNKSKLDTKRTIDANDKIEEIEENLKDVMGDMGLVEKDKNADSVQESNNKNEVQKREIYFEDEDLENGLNKIGLTKESHYDRDKKEDYACKSKGTKSIKGKKFEKLHHKLKKKKKEEEQEDDTKRNTQDVLEKKSIDDGEEKKRVANYQYEGESFIRNKRQGKEAEKLEDSEIMKGIESSGDLTVSGNKSPLVAVTAADDPEFKKSQEKRDKEELEYEKRLERNIQAKIDAIKEEVKREITKLKTDDTKLKDMQRKKREIANTLLDEETSALDPGINIDQKLDAYVRKRRDLEQDQQSDVNVEESDKNERSVNAGKELKETLNEDDELTRKIGDENSMESNKVNRDLKGDELSQKSSQEICTESNAKTVRELAPAKTPLGKKEKIANDNKSSSAKLVASRDTREISNEAKLPATSSVVENGDLNLVKRSEETTDTSEQGVKLTENEKLDKNIEKRNDKSTFINLDSDESVGNVEVVTQAPQGVIKRSEQIKAFPLNSNVAADAELASVDVVKRSQNVTELLDDQTSSVDVSNAAVTQLRIERQTNKSLEEIRPQRSAAEEVKKSPSKQDTLDTERVVRNPEMQTFQNKSIDEKPIEKRSSVDIDNAKEPVKAKVTAKKNVPVQENEAPKSTRIELRSADRAQADEDLLVDSAEDVTDKKIEKLRSVTLQNSDGKDASSFEGDADGDAKFEDSLVSREGFDRLGRNVNENLQSEGLELRRRRRRRREARRRNGNRYRRKRNEQSYSGNPQINYRADMDEDMDEEGDETEDDGFNDQTSNYLNKRHAKVFNQDNGNYEAVEVDDYPSYMERNKRNAMRRGSAEDDVADEYYDNFLFYPNRYTRRKRQNFDDSATGHGGENMMNPLEAIRQRNMNTFEKNSRRKRLEKVNIHSKKQHDMAELSDSDIFGGLPQSYEGELSRFKRVKRSIKSH